MTDHDLKRMACGVKALNIRIEEIVAEMESALRQREESYLLADAFLAVFDDLAKQRFALTRALWKAEQALTEAAMRNTDRENRKAA